VQRAQQPEPQVAERSAVEVLARVQMEKAEPQASPPQRQARPVLASA
jgi:hypothetical protein